MVPPSMSVSRRDVLEEEALAMRVARLWRDVFESCRRGETGDDGEVRGGETVEDKRGDMVVRKQEWKWLGAEIILTRFLVIDLSKASIPLPIRCRK